MEVRTLFLVAIAILGFLSGLLSFIAEGKKLAESDITRLASDECVHSRSLALPLGLAAAIALLIAQIISNSLGGCICCESGLNDPSGKTTPVAVAISCLTLSWLGYCCCHQLFVSLASVTVHRVTFSIAFLLLVAGASINDKRDASDDNLSTGCYVLKSGVFTGAAFASMTTAILGIAYNLQVFSIRKTMAVTMPGVVDGGSSTFDVGLNINSARYGAMNTQGYMAARPVFSSEQKQKGKAVLDHKTVYPRSAASPHRDIKSMEMATPHSEEAHTDEKLVSRHMRRTLANTEISGEQASKQMRKTLSLQQQGHLSPYVDKGEDCYGSHKASQSASASYHMNNIDQRGAQFDYEQDTSQPLYIRSGGGNAWEQSNFHETAR